MESVLKDLGLHKDLQGSVAARLRYLSADDKALDEALQKFVSTPPPLDSPHDDEELWVEGEIACPKSLMSRFWYAEWKPHPQHYNLLITEAQDKPVFKANKAPVKLRSYSNAHGISSVFVRHKDQSRIINMRKYFLF